jgi:methylated-DNA-[protein]-cysteine S-methyltransferase
MVATKRSREVARRRAEVAAYDRPTLVKSFRTKLGWMAIAWRDDALEGVAFGYASRPQAELAVARPLNGSHELAHFMDAAHTDEVPGWAEELIEDLKRFAAGQPVDFSHVVLNLDHLTPFAKDVVAACRRIKWGKVRSYGDLAAQCGAPGAARAVGTVMAKNRYPLIVPCHRVLAAGGAIGGYSARDGLAMKRRLLAMENALNSK